MAISDELCNRFDRLQSVARFEGRVSDFHDRLGRGKRLEEALERLDSLVEQLDFLEGVVIPEAADSFNQHIVLGEVSQAEDAFRPIMFGIVVEALDIELQTTAGEVQTLA